MGRLILILLLLTSCNPRRSTIKYEEVICPNCNGIGQVKMDTGSRVILALVTFGFGGLCDTDQCDMCRGTGVVKKPILNK